jgi:hypothetical protein
MSGEFLAPSRNSAKPLQAIDAALDDVPSPVGLFVELALAGFLVLLVSDDRLDAPFRSHSRSQPAAAATGRRPRGFYNEDVRRGRSATGEGVFGSQRAFPIGGAENVTASLWKVDDEATAALMNLLYDHLGESWRAAVFIPAGWGWRR